MPDRPNKGSRETGRPSATEVETLAGQVLSVLAARAPMAKDDRVETTVNQLVSAVRQSEDGARDRVVAELMAGGVTVETMIDVFIPEAARRMGEAWCNDGMSFADVTIGSARLQALLRDLCRRSLIDARLDAMAPQVCMIVRQDDYHTLGAMVAGQQVRRLGVGVHMCLGHPDSEVLSLLASRDFDMIMISSSGGERLESLGKFVDNIKSRAATPRPVVVGGTALGQVDDIRAITGADFATADPEEALRRCGLKTRAQDAALHGILE